MLTLALIVARYRDGTLADEADPVLLQALSLIQIHHGWLSNNPEYKGNAIPDLDTLTKVINFLDHLLTVRYGCND